ncbi:MAG: hypothetical protein AAF968_00440 [Pseudomonadota bacterium]
MDEPTTRWSRVPVAGRRAAGKTEGDARMTVHGPEHAERDDDYRQENAEQRGGDWLSRNRRRVVVGRDIAQVLMPFAPPPARVPLIAASLVAEGLLLADDYRQRRVPPREASWRGVGVVLDGVGLAAASSAAPRVLTRHARSIAAARTAFARIDQVRRRA